MRIRTRSRNRSRTPGKGVSALFFVVGVAIFCWGVYSAQETREFNKTAVHTQGVVTELQYRRSDDGGTSYPIVRWQAPDGSIRHFSGSMGSSPPAYDVGEDVEVLYNPANIADARLGGMVALWLMPVVLVVMGMLFAGVAVYAFGAGSRQKKKVEWLRRHGRSVRAEVTDKVMLPPAAMKVASFLTKGKFENGNFMAEEGMLAAVWHDEHGTEHPFYFSDLSQDAMHRARERGYLYVRLDPKNPYSYVAEET